MGALRACSPAPVQPAELFPLFPDAAAPWLAAARAPRLWGLHAPLPDLGELVGRRRGGGVGGAGRGPGSHSSESRNGEAEAPEAGGWAGGGANGEPAPRAAAGPPHARPAANGAPGPGGGSGIEAEARRCIADFLLEVRIGRRALCKPGRPEMCPVL